MIMMIVIIAKTVEAHPVLNITAWGLHKIKPACNNTEFKRRTAVTFSGQLWAASF